MTLTDMEFMSRAEKKTAKETIAAIKAMGLSARFNGAYNEYRVNYIGGREATAYYTDDASDAIGTARLQFVPRIASKGAVVPEVVVPPVTSEDVKYFPIGRKSDAQLVASNATKYLNNNGLSEILMIVKLADGWNVQIPAECIAICPNVVDLLTEY